MNLPPNGLSSTHSIFLLGTINTLFLGDSSIERAIYPIFKNIIQANDQLLSQNVQIKIAYFAGDTPISQAFCGLVEQVGNAHYPCRKCYISKENILNTFNDSERSRKLEHSCNLIDSTNKYGVITIPNFVNLNLINPIEQSPMDIMHVIAEGICRKQVMRIFEEWNTTKRCQWMEIKSCLDNFNYGYTHKSNRIKNFTEYDFKKKKEVIVSACQMITLILLFPFIFKEIIDINHEEYK